MSESIHAAELFGQNVFYETIMRTKLPKKVFEEFKDIVENGRDLRPEIAEVIANAMKEWAVEHGATHYTHWFQPMTGVTAEKHDAFISPISDGRAIMDFSGKSLIKSEPDASSFPSGGLRATFEARGYTVWDCTSPAFLREDAAGPTFCIPTAFCSYTGEALDKKTPLLRSIEALEKQTQRILKLFGKPNQKIKISVGAEQEYFLIDKNLYRKRKDLVFTGRTLFGAMPPKGQELDDHYFGTIKERVACFMHELNIDLWKLGVPAKTQHNEAAPAQHELAPIFEQVNIATDHNQLVMEALKRIADHHGLHCLLHEKPFSGVNGSGKHINWSLSSEDGTNLLDPGKTPHENAQFLLFLVAVIKAVDCHADLLRVSACNPGNEYRLGSNEAPPSIISIFLGDQLEDILKQIEEGEATTSIQGGNMTIGVSTLPMLKKDATDRNRTSPFAFTGNKFEFRMVPSSMSISGPCFIINTIVADILEEFADRLEQAPNFEAAVQEVIKETVKNHKNIIFNGNGYDQEWEEEAEKRGLPHLKSMVDAIPALVSEKSIRLFTRQEVLTANELYARAEIFYESFMKQVNIEARAMIDIASKEIMPAVIHYTGDLAQTIQAVEAINGDAGVQKDVLTEVTKNLTLFRTHLKILIDITNKASQMQCSNQEHAQFYHDFVVPSMEELRSPADALEMLMDAKQWPFPTYGEILFYD